MKAPAAAVDIRRWSPAGWSDSPDQVVMEEPLQLSLNGAELSVVMRTPGSDVELALGLFYAEGIVESLDEIDSVRISAEAAVHEEAVRIDASIVESNSIDVKLKGEPRRRPERSMLASSACGVCGAVLIEDLKRGLATLPAGPQVEAAVLSHLVERLREGQGVFDTTGGSSRRAASSTSRARTSGGTMRSTRSSVARCWTAGCRSATGCWW